MRFDFFTMSAIVAPIVMVGGLGYGIYGIRKNKNPVPAFLSLAIGLALLVCFIEEWLLESLHPRPNRLYVFIPLIAYLLPFTVLARRRVKPLIFILAVLIGLVVIVPLGFAGALLIACSMGDCL